MKKRICILCLLTVFSVGFLSAKVKLSLDVGPVYTYFSSHTTHNSENKSKWATHTGGLNVLFGAEFVQNFGVYGTANFAFGKKLISESRVGNRNHKVITIDRGDVNLTYAIDSQFGFFYVFHPVKKMDLTLGLGIGIGGSGRNYETKHSKIEKSQANIGGGVNLNVSYMFTKMIGIYGGVSDTLYAPVYTKTATKIGKGSEETGDTSVSGKLANSFSIKAGLRFVF
jgi:hypothetical protein